MEKGKELQEAKAQPIAKAEMTPYQLIEKLVTQKDVDVTKLEKLMEMQERWEANEARKAYYVDLTNFRAECPDIEKTKNVNFETQKGKTNYNYAGLAEVEKQIRPLLRKHGFAITWRTGQVESQVSVTCRLSHVMGHSEETSLCALPDTSGNKQPIQAVGSTISYLERYTMFAILGLASKEMDTDGNPQVEMATSEDIEEIKCELASTDSDVPKFLKCLALEDFSNMTKEQYKKGMKAINEKKKKGAKK